MAYLRLPFLFVAAFELNAFAPDVLAHLQSLGGTEATLAQSLWCLGLMMVFGWLASKAAVGTVLPSFTLQLLLGIVLHDALWSHEAEPVGDAPAQQSLLAGDVSPEQAQEAAALHAVSEQESVYASTMTIPGGLEMTTSKDVLEALSMGAGPKRVLISLGYSAWGEGQLESELAENSWLTVEADAQVIFDTPIEHRYDSALALLGLQAWMLSPQAGHA
jgi:putative transcriptional regulator